MRENSEKIPITVCLKIEVTSCHLITCFVKQSVQFVFQFAITYDKQAKESTHLRI